MRSASGSSNNVVQAVDDAIRRLQSQLAERRREREEQSEKEKPEDRSKLVQIAVGGVLAAIVVFTIVTLTSQGPSGPLTVDVTGSVTIDGQPVETGQLLLLPQDGKGRVDGGPIVDGKYEIESTLGDKRIEITATKEIPGEGPDAMPDYVSLAPAKYNTESTLTASVTESGDATFDFALDSM